jgi:hypothetical protein
MKTTIALAAWLAFLPLFARADDAGAGGIQQRVKAGFAFVEELLGCDLTCETVDSRYDGNVSILDHDSGRKSPTASVGMLEKGALSKDRSVLQFSVVHPYPLTSGSDTVKLMLARNRELNVNYAGDTTRSEVFACVERPVEASHFPLSATSVGAGVWFGYFLSERIPAISEFVEAWEWEEGRDDQEVVALHEGWEVQVHFSPEDAGRPSRVVIFPARAEGDTLTLRTIQFSSWKVMSGVELPSKVIVADVYSRNGVGGITHFRSCELREVGPVRELSDRYKDYFTDLPDGTRVQVDDYMPIDFIWRDGEIVREVDEVKLSALLGKPFFESSRRQYLLVGLGIVVLIAAGLFLWHRGAPG